VIKSEEVAGVDLTENKSQEGWHNDESGCEACIALNGKRTDKYCSWEDKDPAPENGLSIALLVVNFNIRLYLFAHGFILVITYTLAQ
jgi:hypothetical protein